MNKKSLTLSLVAVLAAGLVSSCAGEQAAGSMDGSVNDEIRFVEPEELPAAYKSAIDNFPEELPDGSKWMPPEDMIPVEANAVVQEGYADVAVSEYWFCAWMDRYLSAEDNSDLEVKEAAMTEMEKYTSLPAIALNHQNPEDFTRIFIDTAKLGDSSNLRSFFGSCSSYTKANP